MKFVISLKFTARVVRENSKLDLFQVTTNIPGDHNVYLRIAKCCPGLYINDPKENSLTKDIPTNCEIVETGEPLDSPRKVVVYATADINATPEDPIELWTYYYTKAILDKKVRKARTLSTKEDVKLAKKQKLGKEEAATEEEELAKTPAAPPGKVGKEEAATEE
jgi:hypothetical protein